MSKRSEFSKAIKLAAFERSKGQCEQCSARLWPGRFEYDHDLPDAMGGKPTLENCVVRCVTCHDDKTATKDIPTIAKSNRIRNRFRGIKKPRRGQALPGSKDSEWKRKIDGSWVKRR